MDKFGIFNVINSLAGLYGKLQNQNPDETRQVLTTQTVAPKEKIPSRATVAPLQSGMINTMQSHDEFVKRVLEKNKA